VKISELQPVLCPITSIYSLTAVLIIIRRLKRLSNKMSPIFAFCNTHLSCLSFLL